MIMEGLIWIILIIAFALGEILTVGLTSIWFAGGALAALVCYALGLGMLWQILAFIAVSVVLLAFTRPWALKYVQPHLTKTNYEEVIGADVCLTETVDNRKGTGTAVLRGQEWTARAYDADRIFEAGMIVKVQEIRGVTMYVVESDRMPSVEKGAGDIKE
jgi:membrane protein implicated in regulation of membrane protease activity